MKKILVTGADGFIGSHLVELLVKEGYSVRAFAQYNSFNKVTLFLRHAISFKENCNLSS